MIANDFLLFSVEEKFDFLSTKRLTDCDECLGPPLFT
jgi:hypothetical protein